MYGSVRHGWHTDAHGCKHMRQEHADIQSAKHTHHRPLPWLQHLCLLCRPVQEKASGGVHTVPVVEDLNGTVSVRGL